VNGGTKWVAHPSQLHREGWVIAPRANRSHFPIEKKCHQEKCHLDRSCSQFHREQRSGEIRFSTTAIMDIGASLPLHPV
jgi:hypothetical protein